MRLCLIIDIDENYVFICTVYKWLVLIINIFYKNINYKINTNRRGRRGT